MVRRLAAPFTVAAALLVGGAITLVPRSSAAFCGFYVAGADAKLYNNATSVVLMRSGKRTVLSMQNDYQGPPEDFALVIPVPVLLEEADVKVLRRELFERVETLAAPRLVEYWEQDPCAPEGMIGLGNTGLIGRGGGGGSGSGYGRGSGAPTVVVEAEFAVGEYEIVILSATESNGLESWLRTHEYRIPGGAEPLLRPYVAQGMKFFVAKVNPKKVKFDGQGRAQLSPLRFHYDSDDFSLPIRLGLINAPDPKSGGKQDLLVHVLAPDQRYEVANYPNVTIPTNLDVAEAARENFGAFYVSLLDHTLAQNPGAVVTEYAWGATKCDPCPGPDAALTAKELAELGADVMDAPSSAPAAAPTSMVPVVRQGKASVKGPLDPDIIRRIVRAHINELRHCYSRGLIRDPKLQGELELGFEIDKEGLVRGSELLRTTLTDKGVGACSVAAVKRWKFPKPKGGATVEVRYPLHLQGQAAAPSRGSFRSMVGRPSPYVLTRLHARYDAASLGEDLVFKAMDPIVGGREFDKGDGQLQRGASPSSTNNFQGRYAIRHPWTGAMECAEPRRGIWGAAPEGLEARDEPLVARERTKVARGAALARFVAADVATELGLEAGAGAGGSAPEGASGAEPVVPEEVHAEKVPEEPTPKASGEEGRPAGGDRPPGCACTTDTRRGWAGGVASLIGLIAIFRRRRRRADA